MGASGSSRIADAVLAGHRGDAGTARSLLCDPDPAVRAAALQALARSGALTDGEVVAASADPSPAVRRRAARLAAARPAVPLVPLLSDEDWSVAEEAAWALGERDGAEPGAVAALSSAATTHRDPLVREAAVAALGALGDPAGLGAVLAGTRDRPAVRRRAVLALAAFEGPEVDEAVTRALEDRDWQVRQAAETVGRPGPYSNSNDSAASDV